MVLANKKITLIVAFLLAATMVYAQNYEWARSFGGASFEEARAICVDASGNVYTTGTIYATGDFEPGPGITTLTSMGSNDIYVQKMDASGNFVWALQFCGLDSNT